MTPKTIALAFGPVSIRGCTGHSKIRLDSTAYRKDGLPGSGKCGMGSSEGLRNGWLNNRDVHHALLMTPVFDRHLLFAYTIFRILNIGNPP
jgi:hypothetical protein